MREHYSIAHDAFVIISVANCAPAKNHQMIFQAIALIKDKLPQLVYVHVGREIDGAPERKYARELGVDSMVRYLGTQGNVADLLEMSDAFVMPSFREGFGIAVCEAAMMKRICIISRAPGMVDFLELFPEFIACDLTPQSLASALLKVVNFPQGVRIECEKSCYERARKLFAPARGAREYCELYSQGSLT